MADRRNTRRYPKKIPVKIRFGSMSEKGETENISMAGIFIKTDTMFIPRTIIKVEFILPPNIIVRLDAEVRWKREFSSRLVRILKKNGLGIRIVKFYSGERIFKEMVRGLQG